MKMPAEYPSSLPAGSITEEQFDTWRKKLLCYLEDKPEHQLFVSQGMYSEWLPLIETKDGLRISTLHEDDPLRLEYNSKLENKDGPTEIDKVLNIEWLSRRNNELDKFIQLISDLSCNTSKRIILNYATSFDLIMTFVMDSLNNESKNENIFDINKVTLKSDDYCAFYQRLRGSISGHLKKIGTSIKFLNNFELQQDEILSPTFEEIIILWSLEKIDSRLPNLVNVIFSHRLVDDITLKDLQEEIFAKIPELIAESNLHTTLDIKSIDPKEEKNVLNVKAVEEIVLDVKTESITEIDGLGDNINEFSEILSLEENDFKDDKIYKDDIGEYEPFDDHQDDPDFNCYDNNMEANSDEEIDEQRPCEFCNGSYKSKKILLEHVRGIHKPKYFCNDCQITLNNHKSYEKHLKENHPQKYSDSYEDMMKTHQFVCRYCHEPQNDIFMLREHILAHTNNKEIVYLGGKYKKNARENKKRRGNNHKIRSDEIKQPVSDGIDEPKIEIGLDSRILNKIDDFVAKSEEQDDKKEHICLECGRVFGSLLWLKAHSKEHKKGDIMCEFCDSRLKNKRVLSEHIRIRHRLTFKCKDCHEILKNQRVYEEHLKNFHADSYAGQHGLKIKTNNYVCRYCLKPQESHEALKIHTFEHRDNGDINFIVKPPYHEAVTGIYEDLTSDVDSKVFDGDKSLTATSGIPIEPIPPRIQKSKEKKMCDICGKYFTSVDQHKKIHSIENLHCDDCNITFSCRKSYLKHIKTHRSNEKNASCDLCGKSFTRIAHLKVHLKKHLKVQKIGGEKLKCDTCKRSFFDQKEMGAHVCKHHSCDICDMKYLRARNLRLHKRMHLGEVLYPCDLCESLFLNKKRRREHFRDYHKNEKKHKCSICDKRFLMKTGLAHHMYTHTGEKPFKCVECGMGFTQKGNLDIHMKLHTNEMPYECSVCHAKFKQSGEIKRHRETTKCGFTQDDFYNIKDGQLLP